MADYVQFITISEHPESEVVGIDISPIQPHWYVHACIRGEFRWSLIRSTAISGNTGSHQMSSLKLRIWRRNGHFYRVIFNTSICGQCLVLLVIGTES